MTRIDDGIRWMSVWRTSGELEDPICVQFSRVGDGRFDEGREREREGM